MERERYLFASDLRFNPRAGRSFDSAMGTRVGVRRICVCVFQLAAVSSVIQCTQLCVTRTSGGCMLYLRPPIIQSLASPLHPVYLRVCARQSRKTLSRPNSLQSLYARRNIHTMHTYLYMYIIYFIYLKMRCIRKYYIAVLKQQRL
jgi:hypothetical protein